MLNDVAKKNTYVLFGKWENIASREGTYFPLSTPKMYRPYTKWWVDFLWGVGKHQDIEFLNQGRRPWFKNPMHWCFRWLIESHVIVTYAHHSREAVGKENLFLPSHTHPFLCY